MIEDRSCIVAGNTQVAHGIYLLTLKNDEIAQKARSGQFLMLSVPGFFLRRPLCIADTNVANGQFSVLYALIGEGTKVLSTVRTGDTLSALAPLGKGFSLVSNQKVLVIAGGLGVATIMQLCKDLVSENNTIDLILGFRNAEVAIPPEFFPSRCDVYVCTEDGSLGTRGFVTDVLPSMIGYTAVYMCGPIPMYKALAPYLSGSPNVFASFEARMGCGYGVCAGCSIKVGECMQRVCVDGPVFNFHEVNLDSVCI